MYKTGNGITLDIFIRNNQIRIQSLVDFLYFYPVKSRMQDLMGQDVLYFRYIY